MCEAKILVADADTEARRQLVRAIAQTPGLCVVAETGDGAELLRSCVETSCDVLVMELVLTGLDGLAVLEQLNRLPRRPKILVLSNFAGSRVAGLALRHIADYFMLKPCQMQTVMERLQQLSQPGPNLPGDIRELDTTVATILQQLGVPVHIQGYQYLRDAITMATTDANALHAVTKILYPTIARRHDTTASRVERSIRHAIEVTWDKGNWATLQKLFAYTVSNSKGKPTNSEFIALIADKLQLQMRAGQITY